MVKEIRRWKNRPPPDTPPGQRSGVISDPEIATLLGRIYVAWPHFEDQMITVFRKLLGLKDSDLDTARLLFTSLVNQKIRIDLMRQLLERSWHNRDKGQTFDHVIDEFKKLNDLRNKYVHGRWWTHEDGHTFLQVDNSVLHSHVEYQRVTKRELESFLARLYELWRNILAL
jgi:hypothetical protein